MTALFSIVLPAPPVAAIETGLFLFAAPLVLMMAIWGFVTAIRILIPEKPLPGVRRTSARGPQPVRLRQIVEQQRRSTAPVLPPRVAATVDDDAEARAEAITEALWARRN